MFVIADSRHIFFPTYLFKIQDHNGSALGTMDLQNAMLFKFRRDAESALGQIMVAEIHPNAPQYFEHAMMTLFRGYTPAIHFNGTESAKLAIKTRMSKRDAENECTHILIWWIKKTSL